MIPLFKMSYEKSDLEAVRKVLERGTEWAEGPEIEQFEKDLCIYQGNNGVLVCNSGTSALHMALLACGVKYFHEVIVPSFTFVATANAVKFLGAIPVFADIEPYTLGLDPEDVEKKITSKTKAIIAVHYAGCPCRIRELRTIAKRHNLLLIEDCAEAMGAEYDKVSVGKWGDVACFSFCQSKVITTGEGGALVTDNKYIYDQAKLIRSHGKENDHYEALGYNFRMSSMAAALGISQLNRIEHLIQARQHIAAAYDSYLSIVPDVIRPGAFDNIRQVYQLYTIRVLNGKRDQVKMKLAEHGIASKVYFNPVHLEKIYRRDKWEPEHLPITEQISSEVLSLPMYPGLKDDEIEQVCKVIKEALQ